MLAKSVDKAVKAQYKEVVAEQRSLLVGFCRESTFRKHLLSHWEHDAAYETHEADKLRFNRRYVVVDGGENEVGAEVPHKKLTRKEEKSFENLFEKMPPTRGSSVVIGHPTRGSSVVIGHPTRGSSVVIGHPTRGSSVVIGHPTRGSVVIGHPTRGSSVVIGHPTRGSSVVIGHPTRGSSVVIGHPTRGVVVIGHPTWSLVIPREVVVWSLVIPREVVVWSLVIPREVVVVIGHPTRGSSGQLVILYDFAHRVTLIISVYTQHVT